MIIQNYLDLAKDRGKINALKILTAGLEFAMPQKQLQKIINSKQIRCGQKTINLKNYDSIYLVAFGKAADSMANAVSAIINIKKGIVVIPKGLMPEIKNHRFQIFQAGHPTPDKTSVRAARSILKFLQQRNKDELVIFLVSGGSSALLALPDGITLNDKVRVTKELLVSGATIQELNCVRKHLSKIKGGRLIEGIQCDAVSLVISDVIGDDLSSIASGTTYFDKTKFSDALKILKKYRLENIPASVIQRLRLGVSDKIPETPKKSKIPHHIVLTNSDCLQAMQQKSKQLGVSFKTISISGDIAKATSKLVSLIPNKKNSCIIFGGETTVKVKGSGKGGRNQELVLRILEKIQKTKQNVIIASLGTDGIDGNTKYAGAITKNILIHQKEIKSYLTANDSNSFFKKYGGLIKTGYTHTNLMDIGLILT
ncbi:MAG: glycerate kinase type-2 family protein [Nitrosopumilaceae archaeon]